MQISNLGNIFTLSIEDEKTVFNSLSLTLSIPTEFLHIINILKIYSLDFQLTIEAGFTWASSQFVMSSESAVH